MDTERTSHYASAVVAIATAEDALSAVEDELLTIARALRANDELRQRLTDQHLPVGRRLSLLESDVLTAAHPATRGALAMLIAAERAGELPELADKVARRAAAQREEELAEVRVAVPLDDARRDALKRALERATGRRLELKVIVDESVVGGVRARIGDEVIDGSLLRRLSDLRARVGA
ncbi:MAG: ATP synthase F1 subunit delta [Nitriliruptoraceae bacterium]